MRGTRPLWVGVLVLLCVTPFALTRPDEPSPEPGPLNPSKAEKAVKAHLQKIKGDYATVSLIKDEAVKKIMPSLQFYAVLYRQFPVGRVPPMGLKASNVFAVEPSGKVRVFTDAKELEKLFKEKLKSVTKDTKFKDSARAWVRLSWDLKQDGLYKFEVNEKALKVGTNKAGNKIVTGQAVVMSGGSGMITAQLVFGKGGQLEKVSEDPKIKPGPRPICQATKLLDKDPIVRKMAEQDLLIMGRLAKPYLDEQKAKASPALKKAIEAMWKRICASDRD